MKEKGDNKRRNWKEMKIKKIRTAWNVAEFEKESGTDGKNGKRKRDLANFGLQKELFLGCGEIRVIIYEIYFLFENLFLWNSFIFLFFFLFFFLGSVWLSSVSSWIHEKQTFDGNN